jgi:4-diphosphocytidyl-2-C-methyl-D-erythritol kinase
MLPLRLDAPAKLNLSLAVTGRRTDGYHELASTFVLLELADRLLLLPGCSGLRVEGDEGGGVVPLDRDRNLAWRGLVAGVGEEPELACLALDKRIPVAAGLGGGSSDAAAAWRVGRRWSGAEDATAEPTLVELLALGADVPFFAAAVPAAWVTGIGERVRPLPAAVGEVVLALPPFGLSSAEVFGELRPGDWSGTPGTVPGAAEPGDNDLLRAARRLRPEIDDLFRLVIAAGGVPRLSGSGSAVFAITDDPERARALGARLERAGVRVLLTRIASEATTIKVLDTDEEEG